MNARNGNYISGHACVTRFLGEILKSKANKMTLKLSDKTEVPPMAFGTGTTFKYRGEVVTEVIEVAWDCGYRWFDTAMKYQTEEGLGDGLKRLMQNKGIKRKEFLVTTKVFGFLVTYDEVSYFCEIGFI